MLAFRHAADGMEKKCPQTNECRLFQTRSRQSVSVVEGLHKMCLTVSGNKEQAYSSIFRYVVSTNKKGLLALRSINQNKKMLRAL